MTRDRWVREPRMRGDNSDTGLESPSTLTVLTTRPACQGVGPKQGPPSRAGAEGHLGERGPESHCPAPGGTTGTHGR